MRNAILLTLQIVETMSSGIKVWDSITGVLESEGKKLFKKATKDSKMFNTIRDVGNFLSLFSDAFGSKKAESHKQFDEDEEYMNNYYDDHDFEL